MEPSLLCTTPIALWTCLDSTSNDSRRSILQTTVSTNHQFLERKDRKGWCGLTQLSGSRSRAGLGLSPDPHSSGWTSSYLCRITCRLRVRAWEQFGNIRRCSPPVVDDLRESRSLSHHLRSLTFALVRTSSIPKPQVAGSIPAGSANSCKVSVKSSGLRIPIWEQFGNIRRCSPSVVNAKEVLTCQPSLVADVQHSSIR